MGKVKDIREIKLEDLTIDQEINPRESVDPEHVEKLVQLIKNEVRLRPIIVFEDKDEDEMYLVDGFHRYAAHKKAGLSIIRCRIKQGTREKAMIYACAVNVGHGKPLNNEDKRRIVNRLLTLKTSRMWSDGRIAEKCGVSQPFVSKMRGKLKSQNGYEPPTVRVTAKGLKVNVENIGKKDSKKKKKKDKKVSKNGNTPIDGDKNVTESDDEVDDDIEEGDYKKASKTISNLKNSLDVISAMCKNHGNWSGAKIKKFKIDWRKTIEEWVDLSEFLNRLAQTL
jgi:ParB/RepB/Spo0J family partition protein